MCVPQCDRDTVMVKSFCDGYCIEAHIDQQRDMTMPKIMDSDPFYTGSFRTTVHLMVEVAFGDWEDAGVGRVGSAKPWPPVAS